MNIWEATESRREIENNDEIPFKRIITVIGNVSLRLRLCSNRRVWNMGDAVLAKLTKQLDEDAGEENSM